MKPDPREVLAREVGIAAAVTGTELSVHALAAMVEDLAGYPLERAVHAIRRARREVTRLTLAAIIERVEHGDGHPGPDEAWAMCPLTEAETTVWTGEMARAFAIAHPLIQAGDRIGARMAFKDAYQREVDEARLERRPVQWHASLGTDVAAREKAIATAVARGRLTVERAQQLLPAPSTEVGAGATKLLPLDDDALKQRWSELRARLAATKGNADA